MDMTGSSHSRFDGLGPTLSATGAHVGGSASTYMGMRRILLCCFRLSSGESFVAFPKSPLRGDEDAALFAYGDDGPLGKVTRPLLSLADEISYCLCAA
jgi:hypothetical protein